jgi:hypothetical protein
VARVTTNTSQQRLNLIQIQQQTGASAMGSGPHGDGTTDVWAEGIQQAALDALLGPSGTYVYDATVGQPSHVNQLRAIRTLAQNVLADQTGTVVFTPIQIQKVLAAVVLLSTS